jgi:AAA domain-containing protein
MTSLANHQSNDFVKLLMLGDAKSGKTGALASLVKAKYRLFILDYDNLLDFLKGRVLKECPDLIDHVEYRTLRDRTVPTDIGVSLVGKPTAWVNGIKMLSRWKYDDVDYGNPAEWGPECILVIDSLSRLCDAAYDFHEAIMPKGRSGDYDTRAVYGNAQDDVEKLLAMLTSSTFTCNVIVICHGMYMDLPDGTKKIFPQGVGQKLSPKIPQYFPNFIRVKNLAGRRTLQLESDAMIDLAITRPDILGKSLPLDDGLATIFEALRNPTTATPTAQPTEILKKITSLSIKRI